MTRATKSKANAPLAESSVRLYHGLTEDEVISRIEGGRSISKVAVELGIRRSALSEWLDSNPGRSARAREARIVSAEASDDKAEAVITEAKDPMELAKAKELAHHYRWRASKISPTYGEKLDMTVEVNDRASQMQAKREARLADRKSTRLNSSHSRRSRMPSSA